MKHNFIKATLASCNSKVNFDGTLVDYTVVRGTRLKIVALEILSSIHPDSVVPELGLAPSPVVIKPPKNSFPREEFLVFRF
jgi:hypothetical protein